VVTYISSLQQGILSDGYTIAVRRLLRFQGIEMKQFDNEVNILMELRHKNIVNLLGYCHEVRGTYVQYKGKPVFAETSEQLLCYEYLHCGSIDKYIFGMITKSDGINPLPAA
jgi:serine/threonine protein kinase